MSSVRGEAFDPVTPGVRRMLHAFVLGAFISVLDTTVVNVALHSISDGLHAPLTTVRWISTAYLLALGATIPIAGWATRRFGTRRVYVAALAVFTGGSVLCGVAGSLGQLIAARVLQGVGGALIFPVGQSALAKAVGPRNVPRIMGAIGVPVILAPLVGPSVGGLVIDSLGWRWIFFINLPIGLIAIAYGWRAFADLSHDETAPGPLDVLGLVLLSGGLVGVLYGISEVGVRGTLGDPRVLGPFLVGLLLITVFVFHARRARQPLLDVKLWANPSFAASGILTLGAGAALFGALLVLPLYFQEVRGQDPFHTGLLLVPQGLGSLLAVYLVRRLSAAIGRGPVSALGGALAVAATLPLTQLTASTPYALLEPVLAVRGFGLSLLGVPAMTAAVVTLRPKQVDDANPQISVLQRVGGALGGAILTVVLVGHRPLEHAFQVTWWWAVGITAAATLPAFSLTRAERQERRGAPPSINPASQPRPAQPCARST